jgi:hypothetical protein
MKLRAVAVLSLSLLALVSCSSGRGRTIELPGGVLPEEQQNQRPPNAFERMYDNARVVDFAAPNQERYANIEYTGEMQGIQGLCRYVDADPITMSIDINMAFGRGPAATSDRQTYRYWVAVTRRGVAPIEKAYFDVDVRFPRDEVVVTHTERIERIVIPRATPDLSGENFEILVGFELTPEQLQFNRDGRRFRIDAATRATSQN